MGQFLTGIFEMRPSQRKAAALERVTHLMVAGLLSLGVLLVGCDNAPPGPAQKSAEAETPEKKLPDLLKRAEQGDAEAQTNLGVAYSNGEGVPKDAAKAVEWYQKAAAQGYARAQLNLGWMYYSGNGVPKDAAKAFEWVQKAAAQGDASAQFNLGTLYDLGEGVPKDAAKAAEWYQKAAAQGHALAQLNLGTLYHRGEGVPKDAAKAAEWYQKAAAQGDASAQLNLGTLYHRGEGVPKDAAKAAEWYQKAAAQGHASAQLDLGQKYVLGQGVPADMVLAYAWFNLSASQGDEGATRLRALFERGMSAVEIAEAQRLSSAWKKGQVIVREARSASLSAAPSSTPGKLSKMGTGTLFVVNATGQAITNQHVVAGCGELRIDGRDGLAKVVTEDAVNDLALVQIPGDAKSSAAITAEPSKLRQGEDIVVFGFPLNAVLSSGGNLTPGVVSALTGLGNNTNQIQITAPIQPGSSGSPVLTKKGEVVGVVLMKLSDSKMAKATGSVGQNVNFAVNGQTLKTFLDTHKVAYRNGGGFFSWDKSTADMADEARKWTLVVECWR
ncbi:MAG: hypothetical protein EXR27_00040 [Betaproteobacteria bacterium]|nr:hypothetical protein [Betaproteobacteria bacterium]